MQIQTKTDFKFTRNILIALIGGGFFGILLSLAPDFAFKHIIVSGFLKTSGDIFIILMKMLVVPIVFVSLVCGVSNLGDLRQLGRVGGKTIILYLLTTCIAVSLALIISNFMHIGFTQNTAPVGKLMKLITLLMMMAPYGVFCLIASQFADAGFSLIGKLIGYFMTVLFVLFLHLLITNSFLLIIFARLNPWPFFKKMFSVMLFAFSSSSSNVTIPVNLETVEKHLGVHNSVASFAIPLGATINMDGTAIMQGVATVFIANFYHIPLGMSGFFSVIITATLASIGTAGVPSVGLITLAMVLQQVGLPVEDIALIIGVDRLLDMVRTAVNITGDAAVACVVGKSENQFDQAIYNKL